MRYIRYAVYTTTQSPLVASCTPTYFKEGERKQAQTYAERIGSYVIDLLRKEP